MLSMPEVRAYARKVSPLYWAVGAARYLKFKFRLGAENRRFAAADDGTLPPPLLRFRVHGALDEESYVHAGRVLARRVAEVLYSQGLDFAGARLLDFACGSGRIAQELKRLEPAIDLYGCDNDPEAIAWAASHLAHVGHFSRSPLAPPTPFAAGFFDGIYAISIFTHLDETAQDEWLAELRRIVRPGGIVLASVHGAGATTSCTEAELETLRVRGFLYRVDRKGALKLDGLPDAYQTTFHTQAYVYGEWLRWFEVVDYVEGGLEGHQDLVVLQRRVS
jgi:SAM-dependent methyltransferase